MKKIYSLITLITISCSLQGVLPSNLLQRKPTPTRKKASWKDIPFDAKKLNTSQISQPDSISGYNLFKEILKTLPKEKRYKFITAYKSPKKSLLEIAEKSSNALYEIESSLPKEVRIKMNRAYFETIKNKLPFKDVWYWSEDGDMKSVRVPRDIKAPSPEEITRIEKKWSHLGPNWWEKIVEFKKDGIP